MEGTSTKDILQAVVAGLIVLGFMYQIFIGVYQFKQMKRWADAKDRFCASRPEACNKLRLVDQQDFRSNIKKMNTTLAFLRKMSEAQSRDMYRWAVRWDLTRQTLNKIRQHLEKHGGIVLLDPNGNGPVEDLEVNKLFVDELESPKLLSVLAEPNLEEGD